MSRGIFPLNWLQYQHSNNINLKKEFYRWLTQLIEAPQACYSEYSEKQEHIQNLKSKMVLPLLTPYVCKQKNTSIPEKNST